MADNTQYYKLASVVDHWLIENDLGSGWFAKGLVWAIRGLREVKLDTWQDVLTELFPVTERNTVILPPSFVDWVKIGTPYGQYAKTMSINDDLNLLDRSPNDSVVSGLLEQNLPNGIDVGAYQGYNFSNYNGSCFFGIGGGFITKGHFKVHDDGQCKKLLMDYDYPFDNVYVEYITDGFNPCGETVISPYLYDYIIKYMDLRYEEKNNPKATESSIYRKGRDVFQAERRIRARRNNLDPKTLLDLTRKETTLTIRM